MGERVVVAGGGWREAPCWVLREQARAVPGCLAGWGFVGLWVFRFCLAHQTASVLVGLLVGLAGGGCGWCVVGGFWLLVENCIVDASIFVVKLCRANGGCLGTRSR